MSGAQLAGPLAAFASSCTWAYASTRYAQASRDLGSAGVNLARAVFVVPIYLVVTLATLGRAAATGVTATGTAWLTVSVLCSYGVADNLFFASARRLGVPTALSIASSYPLWAALVGTMASGERFGPLRASGTLLCVGGVIALVRLSSSREPRERGQHGRADVGGLVLAFVTSFLWAGNSVSIKHGAVGLTVWQANLIRYSIALPLLAGQLAAARTKPPMRAPRRGWGWLVPAIIADAIFGSVFYVYGLSHCDLAVGATLSSLAPLLSVPVVILAGEERWNPPRFAAVSATVAGVVVLVSG